MRSVLCLIAAATISVLGATAAMAQAPQNPPARFGGTVTINGQPAPAGTVVTAQVGGNSCGTTTIFMEGGAANYIVDVAASAADAPGCGTDSSTVTLLVNGQTAGSGLWRNYELNVVNLNLQTGGTPTATPPGTSVPTPQVPSAGSGVKSGDGRASPALLGGLLVTIVAVAVGACTVRKREP